MPDDNEYMTEAEVAKMLKISAYSLAELRKTQKGPPYIKLGGQVRYIRETVNSWSKAQERK